ncbi:MAG: PIG-L family deacetylase [Elusimicrobia bacterium]|nr:PIG-L family deacetylase [Elusimicrobiota bacterium]
MTPKKTILALSAHTDDAELGMGATLARYAESGHVIYYAAFTQAPSRHGHDPKKELFKAASALGLPKNRVILHNFERRQFNNSRQEILQIMCDLEKQLYPTMVFVPSRSDTHQDHEVISREAFRAFKYYSILGYELPWNTIAFESQAFMSLDRKDVNKKIKAIKAYQSQNEKPYAQPDFIESWARMRGATIGERYAETFEVIRLIMEL